MWCSEVVPLWRQHSSAMLGGRRGLWQGWETLAPLKDHMIHLKSNANHIYLLFWWTHWGRSGRMSSFTFAVITVLSGLTQRLLTKSAEMWRSKPSCAFLSLAGSQETNDIYIIRTKNYIFLVFCLLVLKKKSFGSAEVFLDLLLRCLEPWRTSADLPEIWVHPPAFLDRVWHHQQPNQIGFIRWEAVLYIHWSVSRGAEKDHRHRCSDLSKFVV